MRHIILASDASGCLPQILDLLADRAQGQRLLYIPTAALCEEWAKDVDLDAEVAPYRDAGYDVEIFDLAGKTPAETAAALDRSSATFLSGGNTFYLLHHMKASGFFDMLPGYLDKGLVYIGSSAGSVAASPDIGFADTVDDRSKGGDLGDVGLALIDRPVLPHVDHAWMGPSVRKIAAGFEEGGIAYFGLNDGQLLLVEGEPELVTERVLPAADPAPRG